MSNAPTIRDFDKVVQTARLARIGGEEVDVTKIPSRVTLEMVKFADVSDEISSEEKFYRTLDLVRKPAPHRTQRSPPIGCSTTPTLTR